MPSARTKKANDKSFTPHKDGNGKYVSAEEKFENGDKQITRHFNFSSQMVTTVIEKSNNFSATTMFITEANKKTQDRFVEIKKSLKIE